MPYRISGPYADFRSTRLGKQCHDARGHRLHAVYVVEACQLPDVDDIARRHVQECLGYPLKIIGDRVALLRPDGRHDRDADDVGGAGEGLLLIDETRRNPPPGFGGFGSRLSSRICSTVGTGFTAALNGITLRNNRPPARSHVYSTYTMLPSPLMSPRILSTFPVEPFAMVVGMTPAENPPVVAQACPRDVREHEVSRDLIGGRVNRRQRDCFRRRSSSDDQALTDEMLAVELTATVATPMPTAAESEDGAGSEMRPA